MESGVGFAGPIAGPRSPPGRGLVALILSDEPSADMDRLTAHRCKAALPFGGKYRLIDFALSNCANSEIDTVGVITQYRPRSLHAHLAYGRPWDLDRCTGGLTLLHPYQARRGIDWYAGSADAVYQNLEFVFRSRVQEALIVSGCEVCGVDLNLFIDRHREAKADLTLGVAAVAEQDAAGHSTLIVDRRGWARRFIPPGSGSPGPLAAMGVAVFSIDVLAWRLGEDAGRPHSTHDLLLDVIRRMIEQGDRVMTLEHTGYWSCPRTVHGYWWANVALLDEPSRLLGDPRWPIRTRLEARPPSRISDGARISCSLISEGCVIEGTVERSILSPGVRVAPGAIVRDAVVMRDAAIQQGALVQGAVLDRDVLVGAYARVAADPSTSAPGALTPQRIVVVDRGNRVPARAVIGSDPSAGGRSPALEAKRPFQAVVALPEPIPQG